MTQAVLLQNRKANLPVRRRKPYTYYLLLAKKKPAKPSLETYITDVCCERFGVSRAQLKSKTRLLEVVLARQVAMLVIHLSGKSTIYAAGVFNKDHATLLHGKKKIIELLETKHPRHDYNTVTQILKRTAVLYKQVDLSMLQGQWQNMDERIY